MSKKVYVVEKIRSKERGTYVGELVVENKEVVVVDSGVYNMGGLMYEQVMGEVKGITLESVSKWEVKYQGSWRAAEEVIKGDCIIREADIDGMLGVSLLGYRGGVWSDIRLERMGSESDFKVGVYVVVKVSSRRDLEWLIVSGVSGYTVGWIDVSEIGDGVVDLIRQLIPLGNVIVREEQYRELSDYLEGVSVERGSGSYVVLGRLLKDGVPSVVQELYGFR